MVPLEEEEVPFLWGPSITVLPEEEVPPKEEEFPAPTIMVPSKEEQVPAAPLILVLPKGR
jgi:hypothetical protein